MEKLPAEKLIDDAPAPTLADTLPKSTLDDDFENPFLDHSEKPKKTTWDDLINVPMGSGLDGIVQESDRIANEATKIADEAIKTADETLATPEARPFDPELERRERSLRAELLDAGETFSRKERSAYGFVSDSLSQIGFNAFSRKIEDFGMGTANLDARRSEALVEYLDAKFSDDPKIKKSADDLWDEYRRISTNRANVLDDTLDSTRRSLFITENRMLEDAAMRVSQMRELPEEQILLTNAYREYFDNPSKKNKAALDEQVDKYTRLTRNGLYGLADSLEPVAGRRSDLPDALGGNLSRTIARGYEEVHDSIMKYFNFKQENYGAGAPEEDSATEKEARSAFERGRDSVWQLIQ